MRNTAWAEKHDLPLAMTWRTDPRTNEELLHAALTQQYIEFASDAIAVLHLRGSPATFEAARQLCTSEDAKERCVGACILGQLGEGEGKFHEGSVTILLDMLEREQDPDVLSYAADALSHRKDPRAIEPLVRLKNHPDENVRFNVIQGLFH